MQIIEMNRNGDDRQDFDLSDAAQVDAAMAHFAALVGQGKFAAAYDKGDTTGRAIKEFDKAAEKIIFRPQYIGG